MGKLMNTAKYSAALACVGLMAFIVGLHIENLFSIFIESVIMFNIIPERGLNSRLDVSLYPS